MDTAADMAHGDDIPYVYLNFVYGIWRFEHSYFLHNLHFHRVYIHTNLSDLNSNVYRQRNNSGDVTMSKSTFRYICTE